MTRPSTVGAVLLLVAGCTAGKVDSPASTTAGDVSGGDATGGDLSAGDATGGDPSTVSGFPSSFAPSSAIAYITPYTPRDMDVDARIDYCADGSVCRDTSAETAWGYCRAEAGLPRGTKFMQFHAGDSVGSMYNQIRLGSYPVSEGLEVYVGVIERFAPDDPTVEIWPTSSGQQQGDKGVELQGDNFRWAMGRGAGWGRIAGNLDFQSYTSWIGDPASYNCSGHFNPDIQISDIYEPNQNGYAHDNPLLQQYGRWYARVMRVVFSDDTHAAGRFSLWINGILTTDHDNVITSCQQGGDYGSLDYIHLGGTINQGTYDAPAHSRDFLEFLVTTDAQDIIDGGFFSDPER